MVTPKKLKSDVIGSIENRKIRRPKGSSEGKETFTNSINKEITDMVLKIEQERVHARQDVSITLGKGGGENLEFYCDDFQNNYEYSAKESMKKKKEKNKTDILLRPVSELDEYRE
jgi:hypothetical protein